MAFRNHNAIKWQIKASDRFTLTAILLSVTGNLSIKFNGFDGKSFPDQFRNSYVDGLKGFNNFEILSYKTFPLFFNHHNSVN